MKKTVYLLACALCALLALPAAAQVPSYVPTDGLVGWWPFNGNANDESGNGFNGTVIGATLTTDRNGNANSAYYFNYYQEIQTQFNLISGSQSRTFSFWMKNSNGQKTISPLWYGGNPDQPQLGAAFNILFNRNETLDQCGCWPDIIQGVGLGADWVYYLKQLSTGDNQWHFYVFTLNQGDAFSEVQIFVDGNLLTSGENFNYNGNAANVVNTVAITPLIIGKSWANIAYPSDIQMRAPTEYLDDIAIYNRALSPEEITALYTGQPVNPPTACNPLPSNLQNGLVGYWPFCGNANDESGNGNDGVVNGATLTEDRFGNAEAAYGFDGVGEFIEVLNSQDLALDGNEFTISVWYTLNSAPATENRNMLCKSNGAGPFDKWVVMKTLGESFYPEGEGIITHPPLNGTSFNGFISTSGPTSLGTWNHFLIVREANTLSIYSNGSLEYSTTISGTILPNNANLRIGGDEINSIDNTKFWSGKLDDIGIWNRALTPEEVQELYTLDTCTFTVYDTVTVENIVNIYDTTYISSEIYDTVTVENIVNVYDTITVENVVNVYDTLTTTETIYDTVVTYTTVTDTLLIDITFTGFEGQPSWLNTVTVFPNPASDHITIDYGNFALMAGFNTVITNTIGATVYSGAVNSQQVEIDINAWGASGVFYLNVYDGNGQLVAVRHIVLE